MRTRRRWNLSCGRTKTTCSRSSTSFDQTAEAWKKFLPELSGETKSFSGAEGLPVHKGELPAIHVFHRLPTCARDAGNVDRADEATPHQSPRDCRQLREGRSHREVGSAP